MSSASATPVPTPASGASSPSLHISPNDRVLSLLTSYPSLQSKTTVNSSDSTSPSTLTLTDGSTVQGTNTIASYLAPEIFPKTTYSPVETAQINQWMSFTASINDNAKGLEELNEHLKDKTTLLGNKLSVADVVAYARLADTVKGWSPEQRTGGEKGGYRYIVRWVDYIQNTPTLGLKIADADKVPVDLKDVGTVVRGEDSAKKAATEKAKAKAAKGGKGGDAAAAKGETATIVGKAKEKITDAKDKVVAAAAAAVGAGEGGKKKEKKEKAPKQPQKKEEPVLSPSLIDLRIGFIEKCEPHPNADSLYVSTIQCGDAEGPRTVCSGLKGLIPIEEMQQRYVVVVCNLKPVTMRGVKSAAMVLAASPRPDPDATAEDSHKGPVELVLPPEGVKAGEKVYFEGYDGTPEPQLNPKKKVWEAIQPGFTTSGGLEVAFDITGTTLLTAGSSEAAGLKKLVTASGGVCKVSTLKNAVVR